MSSTDTILNLLETPLQNPNNHPILVKVMPGDTLSQLVAKYYDTRLGTKTYDLALAQVRRHNPKVTNINTIRVGQVLKFMAMPGSHQIKQVELPKRFDPWKIPITNKPFHCYVCSPSVPFDDNHMALHIPNTPEELEVFHQVSWFEENWFNLITHPASAGFSGLSKITGTHNTAFILEVKTAYNEMKAGKITRGAYDYRRRKALQALARKLGPTEKLLFKGKTAREAVRISRVKGIAATDHVLRNAARFNKLSKIAGKGGIVLAGASLAHGCYQIGQTQDKLKQNEIMVETVGGILGGAGVGLVLLTGPVGIGVALVIGVGSVVGGVVAGKIAKGIYSRSFKEVDLVGMSGVRGFCG